MKGLTFASVSGLYIHLPFCRSRCLYCGFYSTVGTSLEEAYVSALCREADIRCAELLPTDDGSEATGLTPMSTVYLGGGTPSSLSPALLRRLSCHLRSVFNIAADAEVTVECNPDDVTEELASELAASGVNRVSMGAQTFDDAMLRRMGRRHTADRVGAAVDILRRAGIGNISIDLMFGFPRQTIGAWQHDIDLALALGVEHLSAYSLTYEEGTPLHRMLCRGETEEVDEGTSLAMYESLIDRLGAAGYEHYEISNWARRLPGVDEPSPYRSRHNSSYWNGTPYIGLGAAAHSYDGLSVRRWNVADIRRYIAAREPWYESEHLDTATLYNDMVTTALRTCEGLNINTVRRKVGERCCDYLLLCADKYITSGLLTLTSTVGGADSYCLRLTRRGLFVSDMVMSDLMMV